MPKKREVLWVLDNSSAEASRRYLLSGTSVEHKKIVKKTLLALSSKNLNREISIPMSKVASVSRNQNKKRRMRNIQPHVASAILATLVHVFTVGSKLKVTTH